MALPDPIERILTDERPRPLTRVLGGWMILCLPAQISLSEQLKPSLVEQRRAGRWCWYVCHSPAV